MVSETQLASMFLGSTDDGDDIERGRPSGAGNMIHIVNPQTNEILDYITLDNIIEDTHKKSLESYIETYDAIVLGGNDFSYDKHLEKRNHIIIPDEDGTYQEFILFEVDKYRDTEGRKTHFYAHATYLELKKAKVIYPTRREGFTLSQHAGWALNDTGWTVGIVEAEGTRTFNIENHTNPYEFIKRIANEFDVELRFRVEHDGRRITARYVDFLERIGEWRGREVEFSKDLDSIRRIEKQDVVTALLGLGPERDDGTRIEVLVTDEEALQRWGRIDEHGNLHHLIEPYEIQSERTEMTEEEARQYTRTALDKRINTQVTYETTILDLEEVPGLEHEKIRFGDTIRIKDTYFNPPLYLEARVFEIERSIKNKAKKDIKLGDYIEYTEEEVNAIWNQLRNEIIRRMNRLAIVSITSTAGNVFKNAQGETELTARTFVSGAERDEDGTLYDYQWMRFDKDGNHDTDFYAEGKTITVKASDIDEKATYRVLVAYELEVINTAEITISNVFDGEDGEPGPPGEQGPKGEDGQGVDNITIEYYLSDSDSTRIGGTWTETKPTYQPGKYLWTRQKITYKNPTSIEYTTPVLDDSWKAVEIADEAKQEAQQAKTTADGKNSIFPQPTAPPTTGRKIGDIWFDTSRDNLMHRFDGQQWVEAKWGEQSIVANSITANHIKSLVGLNVNDQFIVDIDGNVKFAGHLEGASGTFTGVIQGGEIIQRSGDDYIKLSDRKLKSVVYSQNQTQGVEIFTSNIVLYSHSGKPDTTTKITGINLDFNGLSFKFDPESQYFDDAGIYGSYNPFLNETYLGLDFNKVGVGGALKLENASGASSALEFPNNHIISDHNGDFTFYGNRATGHPLKIRSHNNRSSYRNDFWIHSDDGTIYSPPTYSNTSSNQPNLRIAADASGDYRFYRTTSSAKYKADVKLSDVDPYKLLDLEIKSWVDRKEYEDNDNSTEGLKRIHGLIAEDLERVGLHQFVDYINGEVENYDQRVFALLIPIVRDLLNEVEGLKQELETLKGAN